MGRTHIIRFSAISIAFIVLIVGYVFFSEKSLESSGRKNAEIVVQMLEDGDVDGVVEKLNEFVGTVNPNDPGYNVAINNLNYVSDTISGGGTLVFESAELASKEDYRVFSAVYSLPAPQGGEDYLIIVMRRDEGKWLLANTKLAATDPFNKVD